MKIGFTLFSCKSDLASPGKYPSFFWGRSIGAKRQGNTCSKELCFLALCNKSPRMISHHAGTPSFKN